MESTKIIITNRIQWLQDKKNQYRKTTAILYISNRILETEITKKIPLDWTIIHNY